MLYLVELQFLCQTEPRGSSVGPGRHQAELSAARPTALGGEQTLCQLPALLALLVMTSAGGN